MVVWRPRLSVSRTSLTRWRSWPISALMSVDLPTPDEPIMAAVCPGCMTREISARPSRATPLVAITGTPGATACAASTAPAGSEHRSALLRTIGGRRAALVGQHQAALDAAQIEIVVQAADQENDVDVRRHHLLGGLRSWLPARESGAPRQHGIDQPVVKQHPIADGGPVGFRNSGTVRSIPASTSPVSV